ncbi:hypothetical protein KFK14_11285 [Sphingobium phenoxybenzoativorans]|uniref:Uncharacterized protein n=1 Tax=Sphingobium phenoxybenzoativorans TaxID=1592790 RepID=A0A975KCV8_9SPHN|nr:hypothetical protein [Sphingobium phenoxybenzoativorans]QUT07912.1 hypothetical protein KFK14_11285 [Sphingobium phenoxybenzoativorans]
MALAHQTEMMARQKLLHHLSHYLKTPTAPAANDAGAADVLAMLERTKGVKIQRL